ncbi:MAG TPA: terminase family protein [bacterium]|nr:terminase family protein [bacterium]
MVNLLAADLLAALTSQASWQAYREDPVGFFCDVLGLVPWARQREVLEAVLRHPRVAVRSGHKVGKSASAAGLALWWAATRPRSRVVLTSASYRQIRSILWRELKTLHAAARPPLGGELHAHPDAGLQFSDGREIVGFNTTEPERMSGISGANLLFILDEASGIPDQIFQAIEGNRAGGARLVLFSNPTRTSGTFFDAFGTKREFWHVIHISSEETRNAQEGRDVIPGLATREWIEEKRREWGETSPLYQVRVRGDFPSQAENAIIGLALVEDATVRWVETPAEGRLTLGVDVARFGDDETVIFPVRGHKALAVVPR